MSTTTTNVNVTFSIPENINTLLHALVEKRGLSRFVSSVLAHALEEKQQSLRAAYIAANKDPDRKSIIEDWAALDSEGWDE